MMGLLRIRLTELPRGLLECVPEPEPDQIVLIFDDLALVERLATLLLSFRPASRLRFFASDSAC
jgi:hypothetical protein